QWTQGMSGCASQSLAAQHLALEHLRAIGEAVGLFIQSLVAQRHSNLSISAHSGAQLGEPCGLVFELASRGGRLLRLALVTEQLEQSPVEHGKVCAAPACVGH